jgi:hypothetical protein
MQLEEPGHILLFLLPVSCFPAFLLSCFPAFLLSCFPAFFILFDTAKDCNLIFPELQNPADSCTMMSGVRIRKVTLQAD